MTEQQIRTAAHLFVLQSFLLAKEKTDVGKGQALQAGYMGPIYESGAVEQMIDSLEKRLLT